MTATEADEILSQKFSHFVEALPSQTRLELRVYLFHQWAKRVWLWYNFTSAVPSHATPLIDFGPRDLSEQV